MDRRPKILIVDDEPMLARAIRYGLYEFDFHIVQDGEEALGVLETSEFEAVISDLQMPGMSGLALHHAIAERWPALARRVIFITGGVQCGSNRTSLDSLSNRCIDKPFELDVLREAIAEAIAAS